MRVIWIFICGLLMGCSGEKSGGNAVQVNTVDAGNISDPAQLPVTGRAVFTGSTSLDLPIANGPVDGKLDMTVIFAPSDAPVTGRIYDIDGSSGVLTIANGDLFRDSDPDDDYVFAADLTGNLTRGGQTYGVDGGLSGDLRGRNQSNIIGVIYGDVTGPDGTALISGTFAADRSN